MKRTRTRKPDISSESIGRPADMLGTLQCRQVFHGYAAT